jgi:hypothetical protein
LPANLLASGDFETRDPNGNPAGWEMRPPNTAIAEENGNRFLVSRPVSSDTLPWASTTVAIRPEWKRLRVSARMRVRDLKPGRESWQSARIGMRYEDKTATCSVTRRLPRLRGTATG